MESIGDAVGTGIFIGWGTSAALYGIIRLVNWITGTDEKIRGMEAANKDVVRALNQVLQVLKGKQNDNTAMVGQTPAGPKKTS